MYALPCFNLITLITYLFSILPSYPSLVLARLCAGLCTRTLALTLTLPGVLCVGLSTYVIKSFCSFLPFHQSFSLFFHLTFFNSPPHHHLVCHFSSFFFSCLYLRLPFHPTRLHFSQLSSLPVCIPCSLCRPAVIRVSWTEGESVCVGKPHTIPQHHTQTQTTSTFSRPPPAAQGLVRGRETVLSPLLPPSPSPVVVETINPTGLSAV
jgi:hypothetical protein